KLALRKLALGKLALGKLALGKLALGKLALGILTLRPRGVLVVASGHAGIWRAVSGIRRLARGEAACARRRAAHLRQGDDAAAHRASRLHAGICRIDLKQPSA